MTTKTHKGRLDALAVEVAEVLKLDRNHELSVLNGTLVIIQRAGYKNYSLDRLRSIIFSPTGRDLMEKYILKKYIPSNITYSAYSTDYPLISHKFSIWLEHPNTSSVGTHKDVNIACALAFYELVNGVKFELIEK